MAKAEELILVREVDQKDLVVALKGMEEMTRMAGMEGPANTLPMMGGEGPFGAVGMGGMFTILKVRDHLTEGEAPGWYQGPATTAVKAIRREEKLPEKSLEKPPGVIYICPMDPEIRQSEPGKCPLCGMTLEPESPAPEPTPAEHEHR